jgi:hypothetical protein
MTTYNTQNPLGSADPRDLYDNAENIDTSANDTTNVEWTDRLGNKRLTLWGFERIADEAKTSVVSLANSAQQSATSAAIARAGAESARNEAVAISDPESQIEQLFDIWVRDSERATVEAATGGSCTIERTPGGQACHMFVLPKMRWEDLLPGQQLGTGVHEAFIENGIEKSELLIGMHLAATKNGELVSQPGLAPRRSINFDAAVSEAQAAGLNMMGNWEWSAVAFWCMANGFLPRGNTNYGQSHSHPHEQGVNVEYDNTATGSGPNTWNHNNAANGIADLVGNVWEWQRGFKMVDGRIFLAPDNDHTLAESAFVDTGWDMPTTGTFAAQDGTTAPESVKRALIMPNGIADPDGNLWTNLSGERFPVRGGTRSIAGNAGLGALALGSARANSGTGIGLRLSRLV